MKNYDTKKTINNALDICKNEKKIEFREFLSQLEKRKYFETQIRFFPKKLLNLFKFYCLLKKIDGYHVSKSLGYVFSGNKHLIDKMKLSKRTLQYYLDILEKYSFIVRTIFVNKCKSNNFHGFRKIKILGFSKRKVIYKKSYYTRKKYFLSYKERYYFFNSLYLKYERRFPTYFKEYSKIDNPFFFERHNPFGYVPDPKYHVYPVIKTFNQINYLIFDPISHFEKLFRMKIYKPKIKIKVLKNKTRNCTVS